MRLGEHMSISDLEAKVSIWKGQDSTYPKEAPFHPDQMYPEFPGQSLSAERNAAFEAVREVLHISGLDREHFGTPDWNPLKRFIKKGDVVLLKPNLVKESHPRDPAGWEYVLTHGSIIRAVADYVFKALNGCGKVIVGDAPQTDSSFARIVKVLQLDKLAEHYQGQGSSFSLIDFRREEWTAVDDVIVDRRPLAGDPNGYISFDLGHQSEFCGHGGAGHYYGADYDTGVVNEHHDGTKNEYLISASALTCDVLFNLPKLKTHKKAGVTICLKNLVGINGDKNWLPHHTAGCPENGGDQFPRQTLASVSETSTTNLFKKAAAGIPGLGPKVMRVVRPIGKKIFGDSEQTIRNGNWYGNDTVWRMCLDLNKTAMYGQADGTLRDDDPQQRKMYLCLVDGLMGGEGNGPMNPDPLPAGVVLFGTNPVAVDVVGATLMGFDIDSIPTISNAFKVDSYPLTVCSRDDIVCISNEPSWDRCLNKIDANTTLGFKPHFGWQGQIEKKAGMRR